MTEPFVSVREFDGAMNSLREDFRRVESKCDQIIAAYFRNAKAWNIPEPVLPY